MVKSVVKHNLSPAMQRLRELLAKGPPPATITSKPIVSSLLRKNNSKVLLQSEIDGCQPVITNYEQGPGSYFSAQSFGIDTQVDSPEIDPMEGVISDTTNDQTGSTHFTLDEEIKLEDTGSTHFSPGREEVVIDTGSTHFTLEDNVEIVSETVSGINFLANEDVEMISVDIAGRIVKKDNTAQIIPENEGICGDQVFSVSNPLIDWARPFKLIACQADMDGRMQNYSLDVGQILI